MSGTNFENDHLDWEQEPAAEQTSLAKEQWISKSQLKREAKALTEFAVTLATQHAAILDQLPLSSTSLQALKDFHKHKSNIARKRHAAYMGKCLRDENAEEIQRAIELLSVQQLKQKKMTEVTAPASALIEGLLSDWNQAEALLVEYPLLERQKLRQLIRNCQKASEQKRASQTKKLLDYLQACDVSS